MTQVIIDNGDTGLASRNAINDNFTELYTAVFPELFPTLTNPDNSFSLTQSGFHEVGEVVAALNFSAAFNRGTISPAYGTSGYRSGLPSSYTYTGTGLTNTTTTSLSDNKTINSYTVLLGGQSWTCVTNYSIGDQPKSSKGNNYSTPLPAGATSAKTVSITGVYAFYATTATITVYTKQSLQAHGSTITVGMVAESGANKQTLKVAGVWGSVSALQQYNTLSGSWDAIDLSAFTLTTETIGGISYNVYTHNGGLIGARQLRFIF